MKTWKWQLPVEDEVEIDLPKDTRILSFQNQHGFPTIWGLVDPLMVAYPERRYFRMADTGQEITTYSGNLGYIGTAQFNDGDLVFHLFERLDKRGER